VLKAPSSPEKLTLGTYLGTTGSFHSGIQTTVSLPFQPGEKAISTAETVAKQNGPLLARQAPSTPRTSRRPRARRGLSKRSKTKTQCEG